ncbi:hypothetical protein BP5796_06994 [Coleophoma crateriformis]|uniref:Zn(2)-C6 fungal-type domain-containing protein n=1 Tax=Coleophoma crateriformis TaxID=565419 RepID=A0A3D8RQ33_9HELO|nr:hypothetical protein BP5796_06994 [Coleophoma crateriformis]
MEPSSIPRIKRSREGKPKVRTGCNICKLRRVKCDETKPSCRRCQLAGRECSYRRPPTPAVHNENVRQHTFVPIRRRPAILQQQPAADRADVAPVQPSPLTVYAPSASIPGDSNERRYFQLFVNQVSRDLSGYFFTPFWTRLVLQECHREPAIRLEICALSALCKASASPPSERDSHYHYALTQQSKALWCFRKVLPKGSVRLALIASLLFTSFHSLQGDVETAAQQISCSIRLLDQWKNSKGNIEGRTGAVSSGQDPANIDPDFMGMLERLELPLLSFIAINPILEYAFEEVKEPTEIRMMPLPDRFISVRQALPSAIQFCKFCLQHMRIGNAHKLSPQSTAFHRIFIRNQNTLLTFSSRWKAAFAPVLKIVNPRATNFDSIGALVFDIYVQVFESIVVTSLATDEMVYDDYYNTFRNIVTSSGEILQKDHDLRRATPRRNDKGGPGDGCEGKGEESPTLQLYLGVIPSLFYVATRCREPLIRREAINLLRKWKVRNGIWDSIQAALIAEWVLNMEEAHLNLDLAELGLEEHYMSLVQEEWRVKMHTLKWTVDYITKNINVECFQGAGKNITRRNATFRYQ